ncbi:MAG: FAD-dependent oxidoreductase [Syntrophorhabdaceae bacterium]|nr:FAD-dependent oxidoreductase [Syntrophorhabdaceae bacterium]
MSDEMRDTDRKVLVVGGGIGGITAALELASCGIKVTMLEEGPSIGGRMIQLDKTFPTLDCSTCTLSPKMVEVALNRNIELLSLAKPLKVERTGDSFRVTVLKKARFVDVKKCTACGTCFEGCPVVMKSEFNMEIGERKAIYIPFPQAIPNKARIDKREERPCKAACMDRCPIHTNVPGYIRHIRDGRFKEAYLLIRATNPLPSVCGRVCYAPCEGVCNRGQLDASLAIRELKRFAVDNFRVEDLPVPQVQKTDKKVAVIGAGPAGLACAHDLALEGHNVTIFEAMPEPGGMLRYAIPEYRLPKGELKREIDYIERLGVEIRCNMAVGKDIDFDSIRKGYDAVFIGAGAPMGVSLGIDGEGLKGVMDGLEFLKSINSGQRPEPGGRLAVIGGGNTAIDCARSALRLGWKEVMVVYRRTRAEMPASPEEVEALLKEGVNIEFLTTPVRFTGEAGRLRAMECIRMELGEPDSSGRRRPIEVPGSNFLIEVDGVIKALGQRPDISFLEAAGILRDKGTTIKIDETTGMTNVDGVFAGGDVVTGPAYVIDAIASGKRAATNISRYLKGEALIHFEHPRIQEPLKDDEVSRLKGRLGQDSRLFPRERDVKERITDFHEVTQGYKADEAIKEASRCIASTIEGCIECGECERRCEVGAIDYRMKDEIVEMDFDGIVLAPGFDLYDPTEKGEYGYGRLKGVMTGIEFERLCSVTGPTGGEIVIDGKVPKSFFFIQCVGSRDRQTGARFCSRVCCMYTAKHASIIKDRIKDATVYISYIDVRAYGKGYEEFYRNTQEAGVIYIRGIPGEVAKTDQGLLVRVEDMLSGEIREVEVDLVVLATGVRPKRGIEELSRIMSLERDEYGFIRVDPVSPSRTSNEGIFTCGMASGPKDIPDTVASAGEAAARCMEYIRRMI